jgi:hypothetical protein
MAGLHYNTFRKSLVSSNFFVPLTLYLMLALLYFGKTGSWTQWYLGDGGDSPVFVWFINWWSFAALHGLNLFITKTVWYPFGFNLTWAAAVPAASLIGLPFTLAGGPVFAFNILTVAAPALSAWTAFLLNKNLTGNWLASLLGGYIFGFSSFELGQMQGGHLNLDETFLIPLVLLVCVKRFRGQIGRRQLVVFLSLLMLMQLGFSTEVVATLSTVGALSWLILLVCASPAGRKRLAILAGEILLSGLVTVALALPFLIYLIKGLPDVPQVQDVSDPGYSADFVNFFIPTSVTRLGGTIFSSVSRQFSAGESESGAYLGAPLIIMIFLAMKGNLGNRYIRSLMIAAGAISLLSLGPWLQIAGTQTGLALPWTIMSQAPIIGYALVVRLTMYVALCASMIAAFYMAQTNTVPRAAGRFLFGGIACLFLAPNPSALGWVHWPEQPFFTKENVVKVLGSSSNIMFLPLTPSSQAQEMAWQLNTGMQFSQSGGYVGFTPRREASLDIISELFSNAAGPGFAGELSAYCATHGVQYLVVTPTASQSIRTALTNLNWPQKLYDGLIIVEVPPQSEGTALKLR